MAEDKTATVTIEFEDGRYADAWITEAQAMEILEAIEQVTGDYPDIGSEDR